MVPAYYLIKAPYTLAWHIKHWLGKTEGVVLYCANTLDYQIFAPIQKYLKPLPVFDQIVTNLFGRGNFNIFIDDAIFQSGSGTNVNVTK